ncbi:MAG: hypothetical protein R3B13_26160 [Polyangiaceae bacterium]
MKRFVVLLVLMVLTTLGMALFTKTEPVVGGSQSTTELLGLPLLRINGASIEDGLQPAWVSVGVAGVGVISIGVMSFGVVSVGAIGVGLLFGIGQLGSGVMAIGQVGMSLILAVGQLAFGWAALGQLGLGLRAWGQGYKWREGDVFFRSLQREVEECLRFAPLEDRIFAPTRRASL